MGGGDGAVRTVFWTLVFFLDGEAGSRHPTGVVLLALQAAAVVVLIVSGGRL